MFKLYLALIALLLLVIAGVVFYSGDDIKPFTSDGCSGFPDGTLEHRDLWHKCCTAHDYAYWKGGSYEERLDADNELRSCVSSVGEEKIAKLMLAGVRVGGSPFFPTTFRWGYGWSYPKLYGALTEEELEMIKNITDQAGETP